RRRCRGPGRARPRWCAGPGWSPRRVGARRTARAPCSRRGVAPSWQPAAGRRPRPRWRGQRPPRPPPHCRRTPAACGVPGSEESSVIVVLVGAVLVVLLATHVRAVLALGPDHLVVATVGVLGGA